MEHSKQVKPTAPMLWCTLFSCIALYLVDSGVLRMVVLVEFELADDEERQKFLRKRTLK